MVDWAQIESLGDNCEVGFVMRAHDHNDGTLLRWCFTDPDGLAWLLENGCEDLYLFENLKPFNDLMVLDTLSGIKFHSTLKSVNTDQGRAWSCSEDERRALYEPDYSKVRYLIQKFLAGAKDKSRLYTYKTKYPFSEAQRERIIVAFQTRCAGSLLFVDTSPERQKVRREGRIMYGTVDRLAPYGDVRNFSDASWCDLLSEAQALLKSV